MKRKRRESGCSFPFHMMLLVTLGLFLSTTTSSTIVNAASSSNTDENNNNSISSSSSNNNSPPLSNNNNAAFGFVTGSPSGGPVVGTNMFGPIGDDTKCNIEELEDANDSQLHTILHELKQTSFFRSFAVDLDHHCPLSTLTKPRGKNNKNNNNEEEKQIKKKNQNQSERKEEENDNAEEEDENDEGTQCASEGLPDLDPDAKPACSVETDDPFSSSFATAGFGGKSAGFSSPPPEDKTSSSSSDNDDEDPIVAEEEENDKDDKDDDDCSDAMADEMDEGSEPLCHLTEDEKKEEQERKTPIQDMISSALQSISEHFTGGQWESESLENTFAWSSPSDPVNFDDSDSSSLSSTNTDESQHVDDSCSGLPDNFWLDMCSNIKVGDGLKIVNLMLNPERNTGYNGTHIWHAIYEENCIAVDGSPNDEMCYEERVLYRLLSGLHSSTTLSIAKNYYPPSKRKGRESWESNTKYFMDKFEQHPDHVRNLHFSYVVLLRALQKASKFLYTYEIKTGNIIEDETSSILLRRLLDSTILRSCQPVFTAFDESLMFKEKDVKSGIEFSNNDAILLQRNFKGVFHNISSILDCVQCQQCKLHGKMAMLGYGTALKILFSKQSIIDSYSSSKSSSSSSSPSQTFLERNEIVALINTIAKFSESIKEVRELTTEYWSNEVSKSKKDLLPGRSAATAATTTTVATSTSSTGGSSVDNVDIIDSAVGLASSLARGGYISDEREAELVQLALSRNPDLLILVKHYSTDVQKFLHLSKSVGTLGNDGGGDGEPDAIIVGSGLAGLAAALNILDRGGNVVIMEKEHLLGGNSNKASSGINACCPQDDRYGDALESFRNDTIKSAGSSARLPLIETLVGHSAEAIDFLKTRVGVDLSLLAQLGGHKHKRTHRPSNGMAGAEIIYGMQKAVKAFQKSGHVKILVDTRVTQLLTNDDGRVVGVEYENDENSKTEMKATNVVLATGGFAADRTSGSYLSKYRPEFLKLPATAGAFSTGDGISLATTLGAGLVDMDKVQIHPTGWVDPTDPTNPSKVLAAELMRGVGGILINNEGHRFCNELGTRAYVTDKMLAHDPYYAETKQWNKDSEVPTFSLVLSSSAAEDGKKHVDLYTHKGLLTRLEGIAELAKWMGVDVETLESTMIQYQKDAHNGVDEWGKTSFRGVPANNLKFEVFYGGKVTPVLHYCMGGITIDTEGNVLDSNKTIIPGLHAAGEVSGGVHGNNRLGGNSLLECTVYGTIVGKKLPIKSRTQIVPKSAAVNTGVEEKELRNVTMDELKQHNTPEDCWVAVHGVVYDFTEFAEEHPAGAQSIHDLAGKDGTDAFQAVHNEGMLDDFDDERIGTLAEDMNAEKNESDRGDEESSPIPSSPKGVSMDDLQQHNTPEDLWVALHGDVYDLTSFSKSHPGGTSLITKVAGTDGTDKFSKIHKKGKLKLVADSKIGAFIQ